MVQCQVNIFVTNRFVAVPEVLGGERMLVEQLGVSGFYHVIVRCTPSLGSYQSIFCPDRTKPKLPCMRG